MSVVLGDPIYEQVKIAVDYGYEYEDENGKARGPYPAIVYFTWGLKGYLPSDFKIRKHGRLEFHPIAILEKEILLVARIQLSNVMLKGKEWYYVDYQNGVQGPFSPENMISFIATRYMTESVKFCGRRIDETKNRPQPDADSVEFRPFGVLLDEAISDCRRLMKAIHEDRLKDSTAIEIPKIAESLDLTFDELKSKYLTHAFSNDAMEWYTISGDDINGPRQITVSHAETFSQETRITGVPIGSSKPNPYTFITFHDYLQSFHDSEKSSVRTKDLEKQE